MRKPSIIITIILSTILITTIAAISTFVFLVNKGKLTPYIERRIKTDTNLDIKISNIHLSVFSGLQLKQINIQGISEQKQFTLECNTITIQYDPLDLLNRHIKNINLSGLQINLKAERKIAAATSSHDTPLSPSTFNIRNLYPEHLLIEKISSNNTKIQVTSGKNLLVLSEMNILVNEIQSANPFDITINGNFSVSDNSQATQSNLPGKIDINTKYSLPDDELIILDGSYLLVHGVGKFAINGNANSILSSPEINCNISSRRLSVNNIPGLLSDFNLMDFSSLTLGGECDLNISVQGNFKKLKLNSNNLIKNFNLKIEKTVFKANMLEIPIEATLSPFNSNIIINSDGKCVIHRGHFEVLKGLISDIDLSITFTLDYPKKITLSSNVIHGKLHYDDHLYSINKLISNIKTNINLKQPGSILFQTQIDTTFSDSASIIGIIDMRNRIIRDSTFNIHNIRCKDLSETFKSITPEKYKEWSLNGNISIDTLIDTTADKADKDKPQKIEAITNLSLSELKFSSPDYDYFGEGINGHIKMNVNADYDFSKISFDTIGTLEPFLVQLGEFTTDMRNRRTHFSINGNYDIHKKILTEIKGALSWDNLGAFTAEGNIMNLADNPQLNMNIEVKKLSNAAFFETFIKDTIEYSNPALFNSQIGGKSNVSFYIKGTKDDLSVDGHVNINGLNFEYGNTSIQDINVNLPISIVYPSSRTLIQKSDIPDSQYGTIQFRKLSHGPLEIDGIQIKPIIISNNFFIKDSFKIPVFDGTINIENLSMENAISQDRKIKLEFQFNNINLKKMATTYKLTPFEGTLNSSIMSFQQHKQKFYSKDEIIINLFGGDITISDLTLNNYLKSMRKIGFSAQIKHLDLGKMSDTYREWGNITGIINGHVKDFKLVAGEPSSFEIEMKTTKRPGIKQTVSTKFLKNFVPGIGKVLDKVGLTNYKYAIMGLRARLENDYIKLQGAVREGEKELFMKGAGMKKLEIVFPNVDRRVPFKTFLNSFKGILSSDIEGTQVQFE